MYIIMHVCNNNLLKSNIPYKFRESFMINSEHSLL